MMDKFGMSELRQLLTADEGPCVTICMPTHVSGLDAQQDAVRLKNLTDNVERQLADGWMRAPEARDLIEPMRRLSGDAGFWDMRSHGLVLYLNRQTQQRFRVPVNLNELAVVNRRFHIRPLLPLLTGGDRFFILALSQKNVRLFAATQHQIEEVDIPGLPRRIDEVLNLDGADRGSQSHLAMKGGKGKQSSVFHGQGGMRDSHKIELTQFFRIIDGALQPSLRDENAPLLLAGVDYVLTIFRKACHYPHIVEPELIGNCDHLNARQIHEKAWVLIGPKLAESRAKAAEKYKRLYGTARTTDMIENALPAAHLGRVETLFVASDRQLWGVVGPEGRVLETHAAQRSGDDDLLEMAAVQCLLHSGTVYASECDRVPSSGPLAAVMRY
jgi:hypothetical protein